MSSLCFLINMFLFFLYPPLLVITGVVSSGHIDYLWSLKVYKCYKRYYHIKVCFAVDFKNQWGSNRFEGQFSCKFPTFIGRASTCWCTLNFLLLIISVCCTSEKYYCSEVASFWMYSLLKLDDFCFHFSLLSSLFDKKQWLGLLLHSSFQGIWDLEIIQTFS